MCVDEMPPAHLTVLRMHSRPPELRHVSKSFDTLQAVVLEVQDLAACVLLKAPDAAETLACSGWTTASRLSMQISWILHSYLFTIDRRAEAGPRGSPSTLLTVQVEGGVVLRRDVGA